MDLSKNDKTIRISSWKRRGVIHADFNILYEEYIKTMNCQHCGKEFKNTKDRCLDHCHETGQFRKIVCNACNAKDTYIRFPEGIPSRSERDKKYKKIYYENNKSKLTEKHNCPCGGKYSIWVKARHFKCKKHTDYLKSLED